MGNKMNEEILALDEAAADISEGLSCLESFYEFYSELTSKPEISLEDYNQATSVFKQFQISTGYPIETTSLEDVNSLGDAGKDLITALWTFVKNISRVIMIAIRKSIEFIKKIIVKMFSGQDEIVRRSEKIILRSKSRKDSLKSESFIKASEVIKACTVEDKLITGVEASQRLLDFANNVVKVWVPNPMNKALDDFREDIFSIAEDQDNVVFNKLLNELGKMQMVPLGTHPKKISAADIKEHYGFVWSASSKENYVDFFASETLPGNRAFVSFIPKNKDTKSPEFLKMVGLFGYDFMTYRTKIKTDSSIRVISPTEIRQIASNIREAVNISRPVIKRLDNVADIKKNIYKALDKFQMDTNHQTNMSNDKETAQAKAKEIRSTIVFIKAQLDQLDKPAVPYMKHLLVTGNALLDYCDKSLSSFEKN